MRLLLQSGAVPALNELPESQQTDLAIQLARMEPVDKTTVAAVVEEFSDAVERIGLSFPSGIDNALGLLDGVISANASSRLKQMGSDDYKGDPWELPARDGRQRTSRSRAGAGIGRGGGHRALEAQGLESRGPSGHDPG